MNTHTYYNSFWKDDKETHVLIEKYQLFLTEKVKIGDYFWYKKFDDKYSHDRGTFLVTVKKDKTHWSEFCYRVESCEMIDEKEEIIVYIEKNIDIKPNDYTNYNGRLYTQNNLNDLQDKNVFLYKTKLYVENKNGSFSFVPSLFERKADVVAENMLDIEVIIHNLSEHYCQDINQIMKQLLNTKYNEKARRFFDLCEKLSDLYVEIDLPISANVFFDLSYLYC